jgi:orotate phosphoribosyltransferase-like protein
MLNRAAELFSEGMTVREVAATLRISKSEAGRLRIRAFEDGLLSEEQAAEIETATTTIQ